MIKMSYHVIVTNLTYVTDFVDGHGTVRSVPLDGINSITVDISRLPVRAEIGQAWVVGLLDACFNVRYAKQLEIVTANHYHTMMELVNIVDRDREVSVRDRITISKVN